MNKEIKLTFEEKEKIHIENENYRLDVINIEKVRNMFYFVKNYNYSFFNNLELYDFENFIKKYSSIYEPGDYVKTSDEECDYDDY